MSLIRPKGRRYNSRKVAKIYRKIHPPPATEGNGNSERRGVQKEAISEGVGVKC